MNTHYALLLGASYDATLLACGPEDFCREAAAAWVEKYPLGEFDAVEILTRDPALVKSPDEATRAWDAKRRS